MVREYPVLQHYLLPSIEGGAGGGSVILPLVEGQGGGSPFSYRKDTISCPGMSRGVSVLAEI